jgi:phosphoribosylformylglycinamidine synthase
VHVNELTEGRKSLADYHILAIPGGFTYGDDIASGKILANELTFKLEKELMDFIRAGKLIIGICNGFQVLIKAGLLPNLSGDFRAIEATLTLNDSDKFEDRWVYLKRSESGVGSSECAWTKGINKVITLPVAHGEGKFIPRDTAVLKRLEGEGLVVFRYVDEKGGNAGYPDNPNGAVNGIAGICDPTGRIFGLMPHPERHIDRCQHPSWTRQANKKPGKNEGDGFAIFRSGVRFAQINL